MRTSGAPDRHYLSKTCNSTRRAHEKKRASCRTRVSVPRNGILSGRDRRPETAPETKAVRPRDTAGEKKPANGGHFASFQELSETRRMRGGAGRTRTACQARSPVEPVSSACAPERSERCVFQADFSMGEAARPGQTGRRRRSRRSPKLGSRLLALRPFLQALVPRRRHSRR
jgi:hypothetical protein